jgi:two-component system phosphate regulon sensor histidine kinase PhoR
MSLKAQFWRLVAAFVGGCALLAAALAGLAGAQLPAGAIWTLAVVGFAALAGTAWYLLRQLFLPLEDLARAARQIPDADLAGHAGDELFHLAAVLGQLREKLSQGVDQVQEHAQRLHAVLESMIEGVLAVDADQRILLCNDAARELLDFGSSPASGRPLLSVTRSRPVLEAVSEALGNPEPIEREFESPGVARRTLRLRAARLPGEPSAGVMVVLHDVTELRRLESLRRELVANVSHELKTPLAAIKAYAETLRLGAVNDPEHNLVFVRRIEEQAERLHQLILDLLQIARVESGEETIEIGVVRLRELYQEVAAQFAGAAASRQIELIAELPPEELAVRADEDGVRTILSNLVDNAIKYTPQGRVTLRAVAAEDLVTLEVQDTGIGIAEKDQARIFERFYRVDKARSRELGGTGLGLSIVKHLAQAMGGSVGLESAPMKGSTFRVTLPRV